VSPVPDRLTRASDRVRMPDERSGGQRWPALTRADIRRCPARWLSPRALD